MYAMPASMAVRRRRLRRCCRRTIFRSEWRHSAWLIVAVTPAPSGRRTNVRPRRKMTAVAVVAVFAAVGALLAGTARPAPGAVTARPCSFQLRIGDVLPFTGDLAAYGANLDRGVKLAAVSYTHLRAHETPEH